MLPTTRSRIRTLMPTADFSHELDRFFNNLLPRSAGEWATTARPQADVVETDEDYRLELEVPGYDRDEINVTVEKGVLTVSGERSRETEKEAENYHVRERALGRFSRSFKLPQSLIEEQVNAQLDSGVLTVVLPKAAELKPREIAID